MAMAPPLPLRREGGRHNRDTRRRGPSEAPDDRQPRVGVVPAVGARADGAGKVPAE